MRGNIYRRNTQEPFCMEKAS